jgi:hypothetical protein
MLIYHYSPATGEYLGQSEAKESPLEPGVPLIPQYATDAVPPTVSGHEVAIWDGDSWRVVPDYRNVPVCEVDGAGFFVSVKPLQIGEPLTDRLVLAEKPVDIERPKWSGTTWVDGRTLQEAQAGKVSEIKQEAQRRILAKWPYYYQCNGALGLLDTAMLDQMKADIQAVRTASDSMEAEVLMLTELNAVDAYEVSANAGWPVI